jgi:hypothetical protein
MTPHSGAKLAVLAGDWQQVPAAVNLNGACLFQAIFWSSMDLDSGSVALSLAL